MRHNRLHGASQGLEVLFTHTPNDFNLLNQHLPPRNHDTIICQRHQKLYSTRTLHYLFNHKHVNQIDKLAARVIEARNVHVYPGGIAFGKTAAISLILHENSVSCGQKGLGFKF